MKKKLKVIIIICIILFILILGILISTINNNHNYQKAKNLFESGKYYEAMNDYYGKLSTSKKEKFDEVIINKISKNRWKTENSSKYTNYGECIGNEYVEINDNIFDHYVICSIDGVNEKKYDHSGKHIINFTLEESDNSKVVLKFSGSDNLYLFIYRNQQINIEASSINSSRNYQIMYSKFIEEK